MKRVSRGWWLAALLLAGCVVLYIYGRHEAKAAPEIVRYSLTLPSPKCLAGPMRVAVAADLHVSAGTTPPETISHMVDTINRAEPDLVLFAGDFLSESWPDDLEGVGRALGPLAKLNAPLGSAAVLGNNDWDRDDTPVRTVLEKLGVRVLDNEALVAGRLGILGVKDLTSNAANPLLALERLDSQLRLKPESRVSALFMLVHQPIMFDRMRIKGDLVIAGHTHGGQVLPWLTVPVGRAAVSALRNLGFRASLPIDEYTYGMYERDGERLLVTSGVGTSGPPIRLMVPPEIVMLDLQPCP